MAQGLTNIPASLFGAFSGGGGKGKQNQPSRPDAVSGSPHLLFQIGGDRGHSVAVRLSERIVVGRRSQDGSGEPVDLDLTDYRGGAFGVSRLHAVIYYQNRELELEDLASTNGTRINGLQIEPNTRYRLHAGDELEFGQLRVVVRLVQGAR